MISCLLMIGHNKFRATLWPALQLGTLLKLTHVHVCQVVLLPYGVPMGGTPLTDPSILE